MPNLQLHQMRAAALGMLIIDNWNASSKIDRRTVITTLLLHDMGNIIKFELGRFPQFFGEEYKRLNYWEDIRKHFIDRYGEDEHKATFKITKEIGIAGEIQSVLESMGSVNLKKISEDDNFNSKICIYSDLRIAPYGVVSINERFDDLIERYRGRNHGIANIKKTEQNRIYCLKVEEQLQPCVKINLNTITDEMLSSIIGELKNYNI